MCFDSSSFSAAAREMRPTLFFLLVVFVLLFLSIIAADEDVDDIVQRRQEEEEEEEEEEGCIVFVFFVRREREVFKEVVRHFFRCGGASGTIAKAMSAYDMDVSDAIYGKEVDGRYVSESRLKNIINREYSLLEIILIFCIS